MKLNAALEDGAQYIVKVKIKVGTATTEKIQLVPDGVGAQYLGLIDPTTEFVEYEWWFNSAGAQTQLNFFMGKIAGKVYFDDISCKKNGSSVELIDNGDFNLPDVSNWSTNYLGPLYTIDSDSPNADFVLVYNNGTAGENGWDRQAIVKLNAALEDGAQYIVKVKIKVGTATTEKIQLVPDGVGAQYLGLIDPTTEFVEYEWWFNSAGAQTQLNFFMGKIAGKVYFDDISCKKNGSSVELIDNGNFNSDDISNWTKNYMGPSYTRWDYEEAITVGSAGYSTFNNIKNISVDGDAVKAYKAKYEGGKVVLTAVTEIPAGAGVIIEAAAGTYTVPAINSAAALTGNDLLVSDGSVTGNGTIFVLANGTHGVGFYKLKNDDAVPAGKAYLVIPASSNDFIGFDDTTGLNEVRSKITEVRGNVFFDLQGRRVANPTKGLYIVNGKKVIIK